MTRPRAWTPDLLPRLREALLELVASNGLDTPADIRPRNVLTRVIPDAAGHVPVTATIAAGGPITLPLRAPAQRLLMAALATGVPAALSHDAGHYLCNYLCWRAAESARAGVLRLAAFLADWSKTGQRIA